MKSATGIFSIPMHFRQLLFSNNFHQYPFLSSSVKLPVKNLLPGAEIEFTPGDGHHHLPAHDLAFQVGVAVVLPGPIMEILTDRFVGGQFFQPLVIIDEQYDQLVGTACPNTPSGMTPVYLKAAAPVKKKKRPAVYLLPPLGCLR